jgi:polysaccharide chain length determinant protein (PEP-CTERM system associated)
MTENRELTMDDYLAMLRRRLKVILIPTLLAPLVGYAVSYLFPPKYTSTSLVLVEEQKVPEGYVKPAITSDLNQRVGTLEQRAISPERLRPLVEKLQLAHSGRSVDDVIDDIRTNVAIATLSAPLIASPGPAKHLQSELPGFKVSYTAKSPKEAQDVCTAVTGMMLDDNLKDRAQVAQSTTEFLGRQVEEAKRTLDNLDSQLAAFKARYVGQLPGDEDSNLKILMGMNSQLDANTQTLSRAQQDKAYTESLLSQQLAAWKSSQTASNPQNLEQQLATLQSQLVTLQGRYTDDYPDVVKTKKDISELQKKIKEMNSAAASAPAATTTDEATLSEPAEIQQLRLQVHQYQQVITQATRDQQRLQEQIKIYQGRVALSPAVEEQYRKLTRDYDGAQKFYDDTSKQEKDSETQTAMEREQQGEQMTLQNAADLPDSPTFPSRPLFAGGGLAGGLAIGFAIAMWLEMRDQSVRTERDVLAILELPVLSQVPWVGADVDEKNGTNKRKFGFGSKSEPGVEKDKKEAVEV